MSMATMALIAWIAGSLVAILFAFVTQGQGWAAFDRIVQTLSAIGTLGAVGAALYLARSQQIESNRHAMDRAMLRAAAMSNLLEAALAFGEDLRSQWSDYSSSLTAALTFNKERFVADLGTLTSFAVFKTNSDYLVDILVLEEHVAPRLQVAIVCAKVLAQQLELFHRNKFDSHKSESDLDNEIACLIQYLDEIVDRLKEASPVVKSAAQACGGHIVFDAPHRKR